MKSRNFLILIVPGLVLLLLFSVSNVKTLASVSASAAPETTGIAVAKVSSGEAVLTGETTTFFGSHTTSSGFLVEVMDFDQAFANSDPIIMVTKGANPDVLPEPGGTVTFMVTINNEGSENVVLTDLTDSEFGDLRDPDNSEVTNNDCHTIDAIVSGVPAMCDFQAEVTGTPGQEHINIITATVINEDGTGLPATGDDSAIVTITDEPSSIVTTLTAVPTSVSEPGGDVTFTVHVQNTSTADVVNVESLMGDSPLDNLDSNCNIPTALAVDTSFQCSVTREISGNSGDEKNITVIASGTDDDGIDITESSTPVKITITDPDTKYVFLPFAVNNFVLGEPNDTCVDAYPLIANTNHRFLPDDVNDWYRFSLSSPGNVVVALTNFVPINDQIVIYGGGCGNLNILKNNGNFSTTKIVELEGVQQPGTYHIRVITKDGKFSTEPYTLRINVQ